MYSVEMMPFAATSGIVIYLSTIFHEKVTLQFCECFNAWCHFGTLNCNQSLKFAGETLGTHWNSPATPAATTSIFCWFQLPLFAEKKTWDKLGPLSWLILGPSARLVPTSHHQDHPMWYQQHVNVHESPRAKVLRHHYPPKKTLPENNIAPENGWLEDDRFQAGANC